MRRPDYFDIFARDVYMEIRGVKLLFDDRLALAGCTSKESLICVPLRSSTYFIALAQRRIVAENTVRNFFNN